MSDTVSNAWWALVPLTHIQSLVPARSALCTDGNLGPKKSSRLPGHTGSKWWKQNLKPVGWLPSFSSPLVDSVMGPNLRWIKANVLPRKQIRPPGISDKKENPYLTEFLMSWGLKARISRVRITTNSFQEINPSTYGQVNLQQRRHKYAMEKRQSTTDAGRNTRQLHAKRVKS